MAICAVRMGGFGIAPAGIQAPQCFAGNVATFVTPKTTILCWCVATAKICASFITGGAQGRGTHPGARQVTHREVHLLSQQVADFAQRTQTQIVVVDTHADTSR